MSYQQGSKNPGAAPYPKQQYHHPTQNGGAPYPPTYPPNNTIYPPNNPSYPPHNPPYASTNVPYPPNNTFYPPTLPHNLGFNSSVPMQMPQPMNIPVYSPSAPQCTEVNNYPPPHNQSAQKLYPNIPLPSSGSYTPHRPAPGAPPGGQRIEELRTLYQNYGGHQQVVYQPPKRTPTVSPAQPFNPRPDSEALRAAMKGWGCDDKALVNILARRTNAQRLQIEKEYKVLFGRDLVEDIVSETKGNLETLLVAMITPIPVYYAKELHHAMDGLGTNENVLIEILCTKSNAEIMTIRKAYHALYNTSLESDLKGDTGGHFKRLMVSLCNAARDESMVTNPMAARKDAEDLYNAGEKRWGTDESVFNMVLCQRNWAQLQMVFQEYQKLTGHDIEDAVKDEFSGDIERGLLAIIRSIKNQAAFFAKLLNESMKGLGTRDRSLIRLVVTRSEIDMVEIKREYEARYGETLAEAIRGDTSGHYKKCLLSLIGEDSS